MSLDDEHFMRLALQEARAAMAHADVPVGCVIVQAGKVVARGRNRREQAGDPTAHAEIEALRRAVQEQEHWRLDGATVYVTLEPCCMCAGALVNARIARLVYGATDPKAGAVTSMFRIGSDRRLNHCFEVCGGVLAEASIGLLQTFFGELRAQGEK